MTPCERRFGLLVGLAWELRRIGVGSSVVLPRVGEALLVVRGPGNVRVSVPGVRQDDRWALVWSPGRVVTAEHLDLAAREIAADVRRRWTA
ncbi:hypothetical protein GCM10009678_06510 [Actinomadura kijaniata]|uniref:Uncharacterized protein n=1 Tax=Actinomadura namibiensis TaxID=182080 RepID=A0A7W3QKX6_ACTNM|nr:hypothetical protein [Actinomadura namibiensis]MBA8950383.1 hypothetical protein [Actinomadura namibiensis]